MEINKEEEKNINSLKFDVGWWVKKIEHLKFRLKIKHTTIKNFST